MATIDELNNLAGVNNNRQPTQPTQSIVAPNALSQSPSLVSTPFKDDANLAPATANLAPNLTNVAPASSNLAPATANLAPKKTRDEIDSEWDSKYKNGMATGADMISGKSRDYAANGLSYVPYADIVRVGNEGRLYKTPEELAKEAKKQKTKTTLANVSNVLANFINYVRAKNGNPAANLEPLNAQVSAYGQSLENNRRNIYNNQYQNYIAALQQEQAQKAQEAQQAREDKRIQGQIDYNIGRMKMADRKQDFDESYKLFQQAMAEKNYDLASQRLQVMQDRYNKMEQNEDAKITINQAELNLKQAKEARIQSNGGGNGKGKYKQRTYFINHTGERSYIPDDYASLVVMAKGFGISNVDEFNAPSKETLKNQLIAKLTNMGRKVTTETVLVNPDGTEHGSSPSPAHTSSTATRANAPKAASKITGNNKSNKGWASSLNNL